jgi:hypothetical protein
MRRILLFTILLICTAFRCSAAYSGAARAGQILYIKSGCIWRAAVSRSGQKVEVAHPAFVRSLRSFASMAVGPLAIIGYRPDGNLWVEDAEGVWRVPDPANDGEWTDTKVGIVSSNGMTLSANEVA